MTDRQTYLLFAVLGAIAIAAWGAYFYIRSLPSSSGAASDTQPAAVYRFPRVETEAKSVIVFDLATGQTLYEKNAEAQLPLASVAKLMLAAALPPRGKSETDMTVVVTREDLAPEGDSSLKSGERWLFGDLLDLTLAMSVNDGAHALAGVVAALYPQSTEPTGTSSNFNRFARELGLRQTYFIDPTGLDVSSTTAGAYGSARDMATLMSAVLARNPRSLEATTLSAFEASSLDGKKHPVINTNPLAGKITGLIAGKTGFTDLAHGNLILAVDIGFYHPVIIAILDSTYEGRFRDAEVLIEATRAALSGV